MKDDRVYLTHISECLEWIDQYTAQGQEAYLRDRKTQSAVLRELQTLAESTQRLSDTLKQKHPEVPWRDIVGFRNVLFMTTWASSLSGSGKLSNATSPCCETRLKI